MSNNELPPEVKESFGEITVVGTGQKLKIVDYVQATYKDRRLVTISGIEDGTVVIGIENPESTGRSGVQTMRLSIESFIGIVTTSFMWLNAKGHNASDELKKSVDRSEVHYNYSNNLKDPFENEQ